MSCFEIVYFYNLALFLSTHIQVNSSPIKKTNDMLQKCANILKYIKKSICTLFSVFVFRDQALLTVFDPFLYQIKVIWSWSNVVLMCANGS